MISESILPQNTLPIKPFPYQTAATNAVLEDFRHGLMRVMLTMATGSGKSFTAMLIAYAWLLIYPEARILIVAPTEELVHQWARAARLFFPQLSIGVVMAAQNEPTAQIVVGSLMTVAQPRRLQQMGAFDLIFADEAAHSMAPTYRRILNGLGALSPNGPRAVGLTATPERGDGQALSGLWEKVSYTFSLPEAVLRGYLADIEPVAVPISIDFDAIATRGDDFDPEALDAALLQSHVADFTAQAYLDHGERRKGLVFTNSVPQAERTADALQSRGVPAAWIAGNLPKMQRRALLQDFHEGRIQVLVNCALLVEGFDEPDIGVVIMARPTKSKALYLQMLGRGTRRAPNKANCRVIDLVGVTQQHSLISAPVLFGLTPDEVQKKTVTQAIAQRATQDGGDEAVNRLIAAARATEKTTIQLRWLLMEEGLWLIPAGTVGDILLRQEAEGWTVSILTSNTITSLTSVPVWRDLAVGIAEDIVRRANATGLSLPNARWRQNPASEKQRHALARWGIVPPLSMTAGDASDALTLAITRSRMTGRRRA
ncbi:MAG: DEAD/DEAH box helicase [Sulfobacillus sp.]